MNSVKEILHEAGYSDKAIAFYMNKLNVGQCLSLRTLRRTLEEFKKRQQR